MVYKNMQPQQTANNTQRLMKRRSNGTHHQPCLFFSPLFVGWHAFVESLFRVYFTIYQAVISQFQQFNAFLPLNKSAGESNSGKHRRPQVGRTNFHPADRQGKSDVTGEKRTASESRRHSRRLLETKSHSSLGRFLHAPLRSC